MSKSKLFLALFLGSTSIAVSAQNSSQGNITEGQNIVQQDKDRG